MSTDRSEFIMRKIEIYHHCLPANSIIPMSLKGYMSYIYCRAIAGNYTGCGVILRLQPDVPPMRSRDIAGRYKSGRGPHTFVAPSDVTEMHGRYIRLETEDDATLTLCFIS